MIWLKWSAIGWLCCVLMLGCDRDDSELDRLLAAAAPHLDAFIKFEVWAHRAEDAVAGPSRPGVEALAEATFAPVRHAEDLVFAVVAHQGREKWVMGFPRGAAVPKGVPWQPIQVPGGGTVQGALVTTGCPVDVPSWWRDGAGAGPCLLLARKTSRGPGASLQVVLGFRAAATTLQAVVTE